MAATSLIARGFARPRRPRTRPERLWAEFESCNAHWPRSAGNAPTSAQRSPRGHKPNVRSAKTPSGSRSMLPAALGSLRASRKVRAHLGRGGHPVVDVITDATAFPLDIVRMGSGSVVGGNARDHRSHQHWPRPLATVRGGGFVLALHPAFLNRSTLATEYHSRSRAILPSAVRPCSPNRTCEALAATGDKQPCLRSPETIAGCLAPRPCSTEQPCQALAAATLAQGTPTERHARRRPS